MPAFLDLIRQAQALNLPRHSQAAKVFENALEAVLLAEGPPPQPVDELSEGLTTSIVRSSTGRVRYLAHTWTTGPWNCLLLDLAPIPLGRPTLLADKTTGTYRVAVDYPSRKMQEQIKFACSSLNLTPPPEPCRIATAYDKHRTFIAWTAYNEDVSILKGDLDNYAKNVLDGLQRGQLLRNDKSVASPLATNYPMPEARKSLDEFMRDQVHDLVAKRPSHTPESVAKALDYPLQRTQRAFKALADPIRALRSELIRQHLAAYPDASRPYQIAKKTGLAQKAVALLMPRPKKAAIQAHAPLPASQDLAPIANITQDLSAPAPRVQPAQLPISLPLDNALDDSHPDLIDDPAPGTAITP